MGSQKVRGSVATEHIKPLRQQWDFLAVYLQNLITFLFLFSTIFSCMHAYASGKKGMIRIKLVNTFLYKRA